MTQMQNINIDRINAILAEHGLEAQVPIDVDHQYCLCGHCEQCSEPVFTHRMLLLSQQHSMTAEDRLRAEGEAKTTGRQACDPWEDLIRVGGTLEIAIMRLKARILDQVTNRPNYEPTAEMLQKNPGVEYPTNRVAALVARIRDHMNVIDDVRSASDEIADNIKEWEMAFHLVDAAYLADQFQVPVKTVLGSEKVSDAGLVAEALRDLAEDIQVTAAWIKLQV